MFLADLLFAPFGADFMGRALVGAVIVSAICAIAGVWVVVRGMAFLGEAMAHAMLPGVALAGLFGVHPLVGAAASAAAMSGGVSYLGRGDRLADDTVIGLLFVGMLATGVIIVSRSRTFAVDLTAILFGDVLAIRSSDIALLLAALILAAVVAAVFHRGFVALTFDPRVAAVLGLRPTLSRAVLVGLVTLAVVASYSAVGTILVVGLLLAPAVAAGQWADRIPSIMALAAAFGAVSVYVGLLISWHAAVAAGAAIAATAVALAALSALARRITRRAAPLAIAVALVGCAQPVADPETQQPHGYVAGATEVAEPAASLVEVGDDGGVVLRDLSTSSTTEIAHLEAVDEVSTDGRFVFASSTERGTVTVIDSGVWTVDHQDHSHYYRATAAIVGVVSGRGPAVVRPGSVRTVVAFPEQERAVVLDNAALGRGEIAITDELTGVRGEIATIDETLLVADVAGILTARGPGGQVLAQAECVDPQGSIVTRVGVVIGCAHGAVLATQLGGRQAETTLESVPYPVGHEGMRASEFRGRKGRPDVAAVAEGTGAWLLDTRARSWTLLPTDVPLVQVAAASDTEGHVIGIASDGTIVVLTPGGGTARTSALLASSLGDVGIELTVDAQRAYVNAPTDNKVYEIDYADSARVARTFPADAAHLAETGR